MKKTFLLLALFFISLAGQAQFNQPVIYNNVCDADADGYASFYLGEISYEILGTANAQLYTVTHYLNQQDASTGLNAISNLTYTNVVQFSQLLFARIVNIQTNQVQIIAYQLHANPAPVFTEYTYMICDTDNFNDGLATSQPLSAYDAVFSGTNNYVTAYFHSQQEAEFNLNAIDANSPYSNLTPYQDFVYVRVVNPITGCFTVSTLNLIVQYCGTSSCESPQNTTVLTTSESSVTIGWTASSAIDQTELYLIPAGSPAPSPTSVPNASLTANYSSYTFNGLACNSTYEVYQRNICAAGPSAWTILSIYTNPCMNSYGNPTDLYACGSTTTNCFNLTQNTPVILANVNPASHQVTYFSNYVDASLGTNALLNATQFCTTTATTIYVRIIDLTTGSYEIKSFGVFLVDAPPTPDQALTICFNGPNSATCWDLTQVATNLNQDPQNVSYYTSQNEAYLGTNPIQNPSCFASVVGTPTQPTVYFRVVYPFSGCTAVGPIQLLSVNCIQAGQPQSFAQCVDANGTACFMLTDNDAPIMGTLNPADYTITYHASSNEAEANVNPLSSPYCVGEGNHAIYARLDNNNDAGYMTLVFFLNVNSYLYNPTPLAEMSQCDDNLDGLITFNLTTANAQLNSSAPLSFYTSEANAQTNSNPIATPAAYTIPLQSSPSVIFIREFIPNACDSIYSMQIRTFANCNLAANCIQANSLCNALGIPFTNTVNNQVTEPGASYGCLGSHPNPTWFYLPVSSAGAINLMIQQNAFIDFTNASFAQDVDYIVYGPYSSPTTPCYNQLTADKIVSCSYSSAATEFPTIPLAQPGQYYLIMTTNYSNQPGYIKITDIGSGNTSSIDCSGFRLNAFLDSNANGVQDNNESNFPLGHFQYEINQNNLVHNLTAPTGVYNIYETNTANAYDLHYVVDANYASMYQMTTSYSNVHVVIGAGMVTYNFPITVLQPYHDLAITVVPVNAPRPGFVYQNIISYTNLGNQVVANASLSFTKDPQVTVASTSQAGIVSNSFGFSYSFSNLLPFETRSITVYLQVPPIPTVNAGQYLTNTASITAVTGDTWLENNSSSASELVINAYDPNDKVEAHGEKILYSTFANTDYLYYTIRFENTGNASAINIVVNDMLDEQLDENTVEMVRASHDYVLDRVGRNLSWRFNQILLPPSIADTDTGKGFITFKVKPKPTYAVGTVIPNTAAIYFDFNPAIVTNTFLTKFVSTLGTAGAESVAFSVYPNPAHSQVAVRLGSSSATIETIKLYDYMGKCVLQQAGSAVSETLDVQQLAPGIYIVEVTSSLQQKAIQKLVIQ